MARVTQYRSLAMLDFAKHLLPSTAEIQSDLSAVQGKSKFAEELIHTIAPERKPYVLRALSWLVKLGVLKVAR